jgi:hypothetical protein
MRRLLYRQERDLVVALVACSSGSAHLMKDLDRRLVEQMSDGGM